MEQYFKTMDESYRSKNYPDHSVFKAYEKTLKKKSPAAFIIMGIFMAGGLAGLIWAIGKTLGFSKDGNSDMVPIGIGLSIFFLIVALLFGVILIILTKDLKKNTDDWIRQSAKAGGCSEGEIRDFDRQAMEADSLILNHLGPIKSAFTGQKNGILTKDYICLYSNDFPNVMKVSGITGAYLTDNTYSVNVGKTTKQAHYLTISLVNDNKNTICAETSKESGMALQELLKNRRPEIDTANGAVLSVEDVRRM